jgi:hypothetical protein
MDFREYYRRLEARDQARRLRWPFTLLALACSLAVVFLAAWTFDERTDEPTTWGLIALVVAALAVASLFKHLAWRLQRRLDDRRGG